LTGRRDAQKKLIKWTALLGVLLCVDLTWAQANRAGVQAEVSHLGDTAHLEFKGVKTWRYEVQRPGNKKVALVIAPFDDASVARLQGFSDALIQSVQVDKHGPDNSYVVTFNLGQNDVESFDYLTDDPSRLILDFYRKSDSEAKKSQVAQAKPSHSPAKKAKVTKTEPDGYKKVEPLARQPAGDEFLQAENQGEGKEDSNLHFGVFDGGDDNYDRFRIKDYEIREEAIIGSRQNIYLAFPMLKMNVSQLGQLMEQQPEYVIHPKETRENKEARLLLLLAERQRFGVFLKTYDYFLNKYPESDYLEILKSVAAHVHLARWKASGESVEFDAARALYNELVQKFPNSPLREHDFLILGFALMERGDALSTLQTFEGFLKAYPKSSEVPVVRKALAEAYMILRKYDEALAEYQTITRDFPKSEPAQEAKYRMGDVYFAKGDYSQAINSYEAAIKELPSKEKTYPNANFNMAEARFWQKDYKKSLANYIRFVDLFPTHDYGGYALTRIGELLGVLGADQRRVMGAFLESYFRFPNHPGAKVARIRMLSQQMKSMKPKELKRAVDEINEFAEKLDLPGIKEFTTLMMAEGLTRRGEYKKTLENLISYYQKNPTSANLGSFKGRILRNIASELKEEVDKGNFMQALEFYNQYSGTWLKNSERIDIPFTMGRAYESAGAYSEAQRIYRETLQKREQIVGGESEKEKRVQENLPSVASVRLRLAQSLAQDRDYMGAYQQLKSIGQSELSPAEVVERVQLNALISEQRNDHEHARQALAELAEKWQGDPQLVAPVHLQLAQTYNKLAEYKKAENHANQVLQTPSGETPIADKVVADALNAKADALMGQSKAMAAVEVYQTLLDRFESKFPLGNVRYKLGQILFDRGDLQGAASVWQHLAGTSNDLLWKIGKEKLDQSQWQDDYNKYTNRIPAMARAKESKP
jgi:tetratricopeptide (TPR) repeat protein